jgi:hypothetical protein
MDVLNDALESMAVDATFEDPEDEETSDHGPSRATIRKYQQLFGYSLEKATELVAFAKTANKPTVTKTPTMLTPSQARTVYILHLKGPLDTPQKVQEIAGMSTLPEVFQAENEDGQRSLCCEVDGAARLAIETHISSMPELSNFRPLIYPDGMAYKGLSFTTSYPTLGKDPTLPHNKPQRISDTPNRICGENLAAQNQYPVWYFFYGTLADSSLLSKLGISNPDSVQYPARVYGGKLNTWGSGKYNALVDGKMTDCVSGVAFQIMSKADEDILRKYETHNYEVVRCLIKTSYMEIQGLTFRFIGSVDS